jgi:hypothetical protein
MKDTVVVYNYEVYDSKLHKWFLAENKRTTIAIQKILKSRILIETGQRVQKAQIDSDGNYVPQ